MSKIQVGDWVRIYSKEELISMYGENWRHPRGSFSLNNRGEMDEHLGKCYVVTGEHKRHAGGCDEHWILEKTGQWVWSKSFLEPVKIENSLLTTLEKKRIKT